MPTNELLELAETGNEVLNDGKEEIEDITVDLTLIKEEPSELIPSGNEVFNCGKDEIINITVTDIKSESGDCNWALSDVTEEMMIHEVIEEHENITIINIKTEKLRSQVNINVSINNNINIQVV